MTNLIALALTMATAIAPIAAPSGKTPPPPPPGGTVIVNVLPGNGVYVNVDEFPSSIEGGQAQQAAHEITALAQTLENNDDRTVTDNNRTVTDNNRTVIDERTQDSNLTDERNRNNDNRNTENNDNNQGTENRNRDRSARNRNRRRQPRTPDMNEGNTGDNIIRIPDNNNNGVTDIPDNVIRDENSNGKGTGRSRIPGNEIPNDISRTPDHNSRTTPATPIQDTRQQRTTEYTPDMRYTAMKEALDARFSRMFEIKREIDSINEEASSKWEEYNALRQVYERHLKRLISEWVMDMTYGVAQDYSIAR